MKRQYKLAKPRKDRTSLTFSGGPTGNAIQFDRVHGKLSGFDDHSKVFHLSVGKATFLQFKVRSSSVMRWRTCFVHLRWVSSSGEKMRRSSI